MEIVELLLVAKYAGKEQKLEAVAKASVKLDALKYFLLLLWKMKQVDARAYARLSAPLEEAGRMLGGWRKQLSK